MSDVAPIIDLVDVTRRFGEFTALDGVTLTLRPGVVGLLGPNGAGKSTLLKIVLGFIGPTSGGGTVLGQEIGPHKPPSAELRRRIGFMPEAGSLVPGMRGVDYVSLAGELCGMPRRQAQRRAHELLNFLELDEARYRNVEDYSAGMKQRVKLAQALVHDPSLLLLDEPTSGLDPAGRDAMLRLLKELARDYGKSMILTTHLLADIEAVADDAVILLSGRVRGQGRPDELCRRSGRLYRVRIEGDSDELRDDFEARGANWRGRTVKGDWRVELPEGVPPSELFAAAERGGLLVRGLVPDEETLDEMFLRVTRGPQPGILS